MTVEEWWSGKWSGEWKSGGLGGGLWSGKVVVWSDQAQPNPDIWSYMDHPSHIIERESPDHYLSIPHTIPQITTLPFRERQLPLEDFAEVLRQTLLLSHEGREHPGKVGKYLEGPGAHQAAMVV